MTEQQTAPTRSRRGGEVLGPWETVVWLWRRLRRMATALWLLFALAAASLVATFIPQEPVIPTTVEDWRAGIDGPGEDVAAALDALGLFDVYGSWWWGLIVVLLFVSLTGCLIPRWRAFAAQVRRRPAVGRNLARLTHQREFRTELAPDEALAAADGTLRRRRFRRRAIDASDTDDPAAASGRVAAERGHWREGGSLLFHTSFYLLLAGVIGGHALGFIGQVNVVEGGAFTDTRIAYDRAEPGALFGLDDHRGFTLRLDEFDVGFNPDQTPREFVSHVTVLDGDEPVDHGEVRVNERLEHDGMNVYQMRWGYAPGVRVLAGDEALYDDHLMLVEQETGAWTGVAKVAVGDPQIALEVLLVPDHAIDDQGEVVNRSPAANNPRLYANLWAGDLGFERAVPAAEFDRDGGERLATAQLAPGEAEQILGDQLVLEFNEVAHWSGFQVAHQPGRGVLLVAAGLLLAGLIPSLYAYRRRVWVDARPDGDGAVVRIAGVAQQRHEQFAVDFDRLAGDLADALGGDAVSDGGGKDAASPGAPPGATTPGEQGDEASLNDQGRATMGAAAGGRRDESSEEPDAER